MIRICKFNPLRGLLDSNSGALTLTLTLTLCCTTDKPFGPLPTIATRWPAAFA